jgi:hypothetical protein
MRDTTLLSPGLLAQGYSLRRTAAAAISSVEITARATPGGKTRAAGQLSAFFTDCASKISALVDVTAPTFASAQIANATPTKVRVTFNEAMDQSVVPALADITLGGTAKTKSSIQWESSTVLSITVSVAYVNGNTATVAYTKPAVNFLRDLAGNAVATFTAQAVTNNVA